MSPFSAHFHALRVRLGIRQSELAPILGYEQSYLSALEVGIKGPPTEEFISKLASALDLDDAERSALTEAAEESNRKFQLPHDAPMEVFKMCNELWKEIQTLHPAEVQMIRDVLHLKRKLQMDQHVEPFRTRLRRRKEDSKM
jgi:transcriptional regulator with XRE-family HTH domain